jgi:hypothetical protein
MSHYDDQFADAAAQLGDDLADVVNYTPAGGEPFDVSIIVGPEQLVETMEEDGVKRKHVRECSIPSNARAAGGAFVAEATIHDVFTYDGIGYMVHRIIARTPSMTRVEAIRLAVHEATRKGLRRVH